MRKLLISGAVTLAICVTAVFAQDTSGSQTSNIKRGIRQPSAIRLSSPSLSLLVAPPNIQLLLNNQDKLQLSDEQKTKVRDLLTAAGKTRRVLVEKLSKAADELKPALLADKFDVNHMNELAEAARKAETDLMNVDIETWSKLREILTTDQVKQLRNIMMPSQGGAIKPKPIIPRDAIPSKPEDLDSKPSAGSAK